MPDNVRQLRGTHPERAESRAGVKKVKLPPGAPDPPADLDAEAAAEWKRVVPLLDKQGLLSKVDRGVLASYCRAWSHSCKAEHWLKDGLILIDRNSDERKSPAWQIWREATVVLASLAKECLLTPAARLRATMPEGTDGEDGEGVLD